MDIFKFFSEKRKEKKRSKLIMAVKFLAIQNGYMQHLYFTVASKFMERGRKEVLLLWKEEGKKY